MGTEGHDSTEAEDRPRGGICQLLAITEKDNAASESVCTDEKRGDGSKSGSSHLGRRRNDDARSRARLLPSEGSGTAAQSGKEGKEALN